MNFTTVPVTELHSRLGWATPLDYPAASLSKPLTDWKMEVDDAPIFRYIYRSFRPRRHLEFGTWQGTGTLYCLEECNATVWTINLLEGESYPAGNWAYGSMIEKGEVAPSWSNTKEFSGNKGERYIWYQTDALGFIGRYYLQRNLGHRVCQIYCDSRDWDQSNYPFDFFDSVLIDGGHVESVVWSDTCKALQVLRPGGIVMWHDFCPDHSVLSQCSSTNDVYKVIGDHWEWLTAQLRDVFWISPSWILLGIK